MDFIQLVGTEKVRCDCCKQSHIPDQVRLVKWTPRTPPSSDTKLTWCSDCISHFGAPKFNCPYRIATKDRCFTY